MRVVLICVLLTIGGCADPEADPLSLGNRCKVVAWQRGVNKKLNAAEFLDEGGRITSLPAETRVVVMKSRLQARLNSNQSVERVRVKVLGGPLDGHVGTVLRPHLRLASGALKPKPAVK